MDTRSQILQKNYEAMCKFGFQGLRTDKVISELSITKGAFYHYFPNKNSVGYAVVDEIMAPQYTNVWTNLIRPGVHVIDAFIEALTTIKTYSSQENIHLGCPLNNLIQEMSPLDEEFRRRLLRIVNTKKKYFKEALAYGISEKQIRADIDPEQTALFILASFEGSYSIGKIFQNYQAFSDSFDQLISFLNQLKT